MATVKNSVNNDPAQHKTYPDVPGKKDESLHLSLVKFGMTPDAGFEIEFVPAPGIGHQIQSINKIANEAGRYYWKVFKSNTSNPVGPGLDKVFPAVNDHFILDYQIVN